MGSFSNLTYREARIRESVHLRDNPPLEHNQYPHVVGWSKCDPQWFNENVVYKQESRVFKDLIGCMVVIRIQFINAGRNVIADISNGGCAYSMKMRMNTNQPSSFICERKFAWIKWQLITRFKRDFLLPIEEARPWYRPRNHIVLNRHYKSKANPENLHKRHGELLDKIQDMHDNAIAMYGKNHERAMGWLRLLRHVRRDPSLIAYSENEMECMEGKISWARYAHKPFKNRVRGKMSKLMSVAGVPAHVVGNIAQDWIAAHTKRYEFEEIKGELVGYAYTEAVGCSSCMTGTDEYVRMYVENPDKISMIVLKIDGLKAGRAILWKLDGHTEESPLLYLDRPYPQSDRIFALYRAYAQKNNIELWYDGGELGYNTCTVKPSSNGAIPYMDSWCGMNVQNNGDWQFKMGSGQYTVCCTEGGPLYEGAGVSYCCYCEAVIDPNYAMFDVFDCYCEECWNDNFTYCENCVEYVSRDDVMNVEGAEWCPRCVDYDAFICEDCGNLINNNNSDSRIEGSSVCEDCGDNYARCFGCGNYFADMTQEHEGQLVCDDCYFELESEGVI